MFEQQLTLIQQLLPKDTFFDVFIAGGAAVAPHSAEDIDVWVFVRSYRQLVDLRTRFLSFPADLSPVDGIAVVTPSEAEGYGEEEPGVNPRPVEDKWKRLGVEKIADIKRYGYDQQIQILAVTAYGPLKSVTELLSNFDISTHQWAIPVHTDAPTVEAKKTLYSIATSTLPSQQPRVTSYATPGRTLARLFKVLARYGWDSPSHPDIPRLQELTLPAASTMGDLTSAA